MITCLMTSRGPKCDGRDPDMFETYISKTVGDKGSVPMNHQ